MTTIGSQHVMASQAKDRPLPLSSPPHPFPALTRPALYLPSPAGRLPETLCVTVRAAGGLNTTSGMPH
eukprot:1161681-Pelagomonas_calceolata.AAC.1